MSLILLSSWFKCNSVDINFFTGRTERLPKSFRNRLWIWEESYHGRVGLLKKKITLCIHEILSYAKS